MKKQSSQRLADIAADKLLRILKNLVILRGLSARCCIMQVRPSDKAPSRFHVFGIEDEEGDAEKLFRCMEQSRNFATVRPPEYTAAGEFHVTFTASKAFWRDYLGLRARKGVRKRSRRPVSRPGALQRA